MNYTDITKFFGTKLSDPRFQAFLTYLGCTPDNFRNTDFAYLSPKDKSIEFGFCIKETMGKSPIFTLFNLYPNCSNYLRSLPFDLSFSDYKETVRMKAGRPIKEVDHKSDLIKKHFIIDHFKMDHLAVSIDYSARDGKVEMIQIRDNRLADDYIKL